MGKHQKDQRRDTDDVVADLDAVVLALKGAATLAWSGEFADTPSLVVIEVAAVVDLATARLTEIVRNLADSKTE